MQEEQLRLELFIQLLNKDVLPKKENGIIMPDESINVVDKLVDYVIKGKAGKLKIM